MMFVVYCCHQWCSSITTTPLMAAVNNKHHQMVELLLTKGADPNLMDGVSN